MINSVAENAIRFIALLFFQVLILDHIELGGYLNPFLYILFIIMLPFETPEWLVLLLGFFLGLVIDMFTDTLGMHTTATVFIAFLRKYILRVLAPRDGYENTFKPTFRQMGLSWFLIYSSLMIVIHHFILFYLEIFRFSDFFTTFIKVIFSSVFTLLLVLITQFIFNTPRQR
jgi:rod shape-determining protein MreD